MLPPSKSRYKYKCITLFFKLPPVDPQLPKPQKHFDNPGLAADIQQFKFKTFDYLQAYLGGYHYILKGGSCKHKRGGRGGQIFMDPFDGGPQHFAECLDRAGERGKILYD